MLTNIWGDGGQIARSMTHYTPDLKIMIHGETNVDFLEENLSYSQTERGIDGYSVVPVMPVILFHSMQNEGERERDSIKIVNKVRLMIFSSPLGNRKDHLDRIIRDQILCRRKEQTRTMVWANCADIKVYKERERESEPI